MSGYPSDMAHSILLVEDDPHDLELFQSAFALTGRSSARAAHGVDDALEVLAASAGAGEPPVRLVMLDLRLGDADGIDALRRIRADERFSAIPVVVFTDSEAESDLLRSYDAAANAYVVKPRSREALSTTVQRICQFWLGLNVMPGDPPALGLGLGLSRA